MMKKFIIRAILNKVYKNITSGRSSRKIKKTRLAKIAFLLARISRRNIQKKVKFS